MSSGLDYFRKLEKVEIFWGFPAQYSKVHPSTEQLARVGLSLLAGQPTTSGELKQAVPSLSLKNKEPIGKRPPRSE